MKKEFHLAAKSAVAEDDVLEFDIPIPSDEEDGEPTVETFTVRKASTAQMALFFASMDSGGAESLSAAFTLVRGLMEAAQYRRLRKLIADGLIPLELLLGGDELNDDGIIEWIIEASTDRPTKAPTDFLPSQKTGGQRSTGRSQGVGSIPSP